MTNSLQTFNFENLPIRIIDQNGGFWFVVNDVCEILQIANARDAISRLDDDEKADVALTDISSNGVEQSRKVNIINESGLYILILRSRKAMEKGTIQHKFRKWVTSEVLPSIRKTGSYSQKTTVADRTPLRQAVTALVAKGIAHDEAYRMVHQYMGVNHIDEIALHDLPKAVEYVHRLMLCAEQNQTTKQSHLTQADALILAKVLDYARLYADFAPKIQTPKGQEHITTLYCNNTSNEDDGFFICYRPNYKDDIEKAMTLFRNIAQNSLLPTA